LACASGITLKATHALMSREAGGRANLGYKIFLKKFKKKKKKKKKKLSSNKTAKESDIW